MIVTFSPLFGSRLCSKRFLSIKLSHDWRKTISAMDRSHLYYYSTVIIQVTGVGVGGGWWQVIKVWQINKPGHFPSNFSPLFSVKESYGLQVKVEWKHCLPAFPFGTAAAISFLHIASPAWSDKTLAFLLLNKASRDSLTVTMRSGSGGALSFSDFCNNKIHSVHIQQLKNNPFATHSTGNVFLCLLASLCNCWTSTYNFDAQKCIRVI